MRKLDYISITIMFLIIIYFFYNSVQQTIKIAKQDIYLYELQQQYQDIIDIEYAEWYQDWLKRNSLE